MRHLFRPLWLVASLAIGATSVNAAQPVSVIELFTSQGCSSCPPANDNVRALADRPDIIALSFGVTYWDQLGWKDSFAQPAFTARQYAYARALGHGSPFTPEVVVDGHADVVGARRGEIEALAARTRLSGGPNIELRGGEVSLGAASPPARAADVWLVRYDPRVIAVPVRAGENAGQAETFAIPPAAPGLATAVLVQAPGAGPILAAAKG
jgi:hypothetical protein